MSVQDIIYTTTHILLSVEYLLLASASSFVLCRLVRNPVIHPYKVVFLVLAMIGAIGRSYIFNIPLENRLINSDLARCIDFITITLSFTSVIVLSNSYGFILAVLPSLIFLNAYGIVLFQWILMLYIIQSVISHKGDPEKGKTVLISLYFGKYRKH